MNIGEAIAEFRSGHPGCKAVVLADLSTGMVLAASTAERMTQERLDALCSAACASFRGPEAMAMAAQSAVTVWRSDATGLHCFVKAPHPAAEALCLTLEDPAALPRASAGAARLIARILAES